MTLPIIGTYSAYTMKSSTTKNLNLIFDRRAKIQDIRGEFAKMGVKIYSDVSYRSGDSLVWSIVARDDAALMAATLKFADWVG